MYTTHINALLQWLFDIESYSGYIKSGNLVLSSVIGHLLN